MSKVRTRFAPSPTGFLHIGGIRTALYAYALAKKHGGEFVLRIEDTDQDRLVEGAEAEILEMLEAYELNPDESIIHGGDHGPYRQSDRREIYKKYAEQLVESGHAYYSFETKAETDSARELAIANNDRTVYRSPYRDLSIEEAKARIAKGDSYTIRQRLEENKEIFFEDPLQGKMLFNTDELDEGVLMKSDGLPTYHLAVVVDDHLMEISHVFRGVEWIPSLPKHVLLYQAFGWEMPVIAHLPVILDPDGGKLSKRRGAVSAKEFLKEGYLSEAMLNFLMLLGWSAPIKREFGEKEQEIFTLNDFVEMFDLHDLNKSSPVFNREKLLWFNQQYLATASTDNLLNRFTGWLSEYGQNEDLKTKITEKGPDFLGKILELEKHRIKLLSEIPAAIGFYFDRPAKFDFASSKRLKKIDKDQYSKLFAQFLGMIGEIDNLADWSHEQWESEVRGLADKLGMKAGEAFMSLRVAVTGSEVSPPLYEVMQILGKVEVSERINEYLA